MTTTLPSRAMVARPSRRPARPAAADTSNEAPEARSETGEMASHGASAIPSAKAAASGSSGVWAQRNYGASRIRQPEGEDDTRAMASADAASVIGRSP